MSDNIKRSVNLTPNKDVHLTCLCGETQSSEFFDPFNKTGFFKGFTLQECKQCSLVRTDPSPLANEEEAKDLYDDPNYYAESILNTPFWLKMASKTIQDLSRLETRGRLLDIGCGVGNIVKAAENMGFEASGIDLNPHAIKTGKEIYDINIEHKTIDQVEGKFDVIVSNHVIEHVLDPIGFINEIEKRLNPGGYMLLGAPNVNGGIPKTLRFINKIPKIPGSNWLWVGYQPQEHLWHFTPTTMETFLERNKWEIKNTRVNLNNSYAYVQMPRLRQRLIQYLWKFFEFFNQADEFTILSQKSK